MTGENYKVYGNMDFQQWKAVMNKYVDNSDKPGIIKSSKKVRATEIEEKRSTIRTYSSLWSKEQLDELIRDEEISKKYLEIAAQNGRTILHYDAEIYERTVEKLCEEFRVELSKEY